MMAATESARRGRRRLSYFIGGEMAAPIERAIEQQRVLTLDEIAVASGGPLAPIRQDQRRLSAMFTPTGAVA